MNDKKFSSTLFALSFSGMFALSIQAATIVKDDNTDDLNLGTSWVGGTAPGSGDVAVWDSTVTGANSTSLGGNLSWSGLSVTNPGGAVTIGGSHTLTLGSSGLNVASGQTFTYNSSGTLNMTNNATFSGAGTVNINNSAYDNWSIDSSGMANVTFTGTLNLSGGGWFAFGNASVSQTGSFALHTGNSGSGKALIVTDGWGDGVSKPKLHLSSLQGYGDLLVNWGAYTIRTVWVDQTSNTTFNGVIGASGSGTRSIALEKSGSGTLTLSGINVHQGGTTVNGGTLRLTASSGGTGTIRGTLNINSGAVVEIGGADVLGYSGSLGTININGGTLRQTQNRNETNAAIINMSNGALIEATQGYFDMFGSSAIHSSGNIQNTISSNLRLRRNNTPITVANGSAAVDLLISGSISQFEGNRAIIKSGDGTLLLTGNNTYRGNTTIEGGVLELGSSGKLYNGGYNNFAVVTVKTGGTWKLPDFSYAGVGHLADYAHLRVLDGGTIEVTGGTHSSGQDFTVSSNGGTFRYTSTGNTLTLVGNGNSDIQLNGQLTLDTVGNITVEGSSAGIQGTGGITKTGSGTLTLSSGTSDYSGTTYVNQGQLIAKGGVGDHSTVHMANTAGVSMQVTENEQVGALAGGGASGGNISISAGKTLITGHNNSNTTYDGVISGGGSIEKWGTGTQTLTGDNTFTGGVSIRGGGILEVPFVANTGVAQPLGTGASPITFSGVAALSIQQTSSTNRGLQLANANPQALIVSSGETVTMSGPITGGGSSAELQLFGGGTFTQAGVGTWNSTLYVDGSTYTVASTGHIENIGQILLDSSTLNINTLTHVRTSDIQALDSTVNLQAGTLRTNGIALAGGSVFNWGAATLAPQQIASGNSGSTDRTGAGGPASGQPLYEGTILNVTGNLATNSGSTLDLGPMYYSGGNRYDMLKVSGTLDLSADDDTLNIVINPYFLRPFGPNTVSTGDWGTLVLAHADSILGEFADITGILSDSIGWTQLATETNSNRDPSTLEMDEWVIEYRTSGSMIMAGGAEILLHYRVSGTVPEPASAGLIIGGILLIRTLTRKRK